MTLTPDGMRFEPVVPESMSSISISGLRYNKMKLNIQLTGSGDKIKRFKVDGSWSEESFLPPDRTGQVKIEIELSK